MSSLPLTILEQAEGKAVRATKEGEAMKAAIYCRVSTEDQEREGTSLDTQLEACLKLVRGKGSFLFSLLRNGNKKERFSDISKYLNNWIGKMNKEMD